MFGVKSTSLFHEQNWRLLLRRNSCELQKRQIRTEGTWLETYTAREIRQTDEPEHAKSIAKVVGTRSFHFTCFLALHGMGF